MMMRRAAVVLGVLAVCAGAASQPEVATQAAKTTGMIGLEKLLNSMPVNLRPEPNETDIKIQARHQWYAKNLKGTLGPWTFTGKIKSIHSTNVRTDSSHTQKRVEVSLASSDIQAWDSDWIVEVDALLNNVEPESAIDWSVGKSMTVTGAATIVNYGNVEKPQQIDLKMADAKMKK